MSSNGSVVERARHLVEAVRSSIYPERADRKGRELFFISAARLAVQVTRQLIRDRVLVQAGSLSFQTLLSVVPLVIVVLWAWKLMRGDAGRESLDDLLELVLPPAVDPAARALARLTASVDVGTLGLASLASLFVVAITLLYSMEDAFCTIWHVRTNRPLVRRFMTFWAILTLSPVLIGLSLRYGRVFLVIPNVGALLFSLSLTVAVLFLAYRLLPATRVKNAPALLGAVVAGVVFEIMKRGFGAYAESVRTTYSSLYGAIAFFPVLCVWIYASWVVVLFGVEISFTRQNLRALWERDRQALAGLSETPARRLGPKAALRVLVAITERFVAGKGPTSRDQLCARYRLPSDIMDGALDVLTDADLLIRAGDDEYLPGRPPEKITVGEVFSLFEGPDPISEEARTAADARLVEAFARMSAAVRDAADTTIADILGAT